MYVYIHIIYISISDRYGLHILKRPFLKKKRAEAVHVLPCARPPIFQFGPIFVIIDWGPAVYPIRVTTRHLYILRSNDYPDSHCELCARIRVYPAVCVQRNGYSDDRTWWKKKLERIKSEPREAREKAGRELTSANRPDKLVLRKQYSNPSAFLPTSTL